MLPAPFFWPEAGKFEQAVADFSTAISHDPACATAYAARGDCYVKLNKLDKARDDYRKAFKLNPCFPRCL